MIITLVLYQNVEIAIFLASVLSRGWIAPMVEEWSNGLNHLFLYFIGPHSTSSTSKCVS